MVSDEVRLRAVFGERAPDPGSIGSFHELMQFRVARLLLVSNLYDSFMVAEDRLAEELILGEFLGVELSSIPEIRRVSTGGEALEAISQPPGYDLVISSPWIGDMDAGELGRKLRRRGVESPVVMLSYHAHELHEHLRNFDQKGIDRSFLFQGNIQLFLAIVKYAEDLLNVEHDVDAMGVQVILVVEDNIRYYSYFLPVIYTAVLQNTASLVPDGVNLAHKLLRAKARPKILLASTYEDAERYFSQYADNILGVISDVEFPKDGELCADAGVQFAREVLRRKADVPILLNSGKLENERLARETGTSFLHKYSPTLLSELQEFMGENFGFGDFVFRLPDGTEVARAGDLRALEKALHEVPGESITFHASRNQFSAWLKAHTEFDIAHRLRPRRLSDFTGPDDIRRYLIESISSHRDDRRGSVVADFDPDRFNPDRGFARIGGGSLGGKARGLAFARRLLRQAGLDDVFPDVRIRVPASVVVGTDVFDDFLKTNRVRDTVLRANDDEAVRASFAGAHFASDVRRDLRAFLEIARYPLAVRSSSLLEDAKYQPFSGVYDTVMIANDHEDIEVRLRHLEAAIKHVYASTFSQRAKRYMASTSYRLEAEKMAVILQRVTGAAHEDRFYPDFAGVALSHNHYPVAPVRSEDGLVAIALGMGAEVVEGDQCLRFSPRHPDRLLQMSSVKDALRNSQREFYALQLGEKRDDGLAELGRHELAVAERDGTLQWLGSTYSSENDAIYDGVSRPGARLVTFAPMLKYGPFPLADVLAELLQIGAYAAGGPVEIEFAGNLAGPSDEPKALGFLQLRPVVQLLAAGSLDITEVDRTLAVCESTTVLGTGQIELHDAVVVDYHAFERGQSQLVAGQVARFNAELLAQERPYVLIGVGRWGSSDPLLGIPVTWDEIAGARVIVETGFRDFEVQPSQGTHFFQNLIANNIGYFTINPQLGQGTVDWDWLLEQPSERSTEFVRCLRFERPLTVLMDGNRNEGVILRPRGPDAAPSAASSPAA